MPSQATHVKGPNRHLEDFSPRQQITDRHVSKLDEVAGGTGIFARVRHLTAGLRSLSSAGYSMRHLSLLPASPVVNKGYIRHKRVLVGICLILWGEVVTAAAGWSRSSENEWVKHLHSITLLHGALEQCEQVDVSSADAYFRHVDHLGFREGSCKGAGFAVALSDPEQVEEDVVIGEYGKAVPLDGASRILRGTKIRWALAR